MLFTKIDEKNKIATLEADSPLTRSDFEISKKIFVNYTKDNGKLKGLIIYTEKFPGWGSVSDFPYHMKFATEHRDKAEKVAFVTNSLWSFLVKLFGFILTGATTKVFKYHELEQAKSWVLE